MADTIAYPVEVGRAVFSELLTQQRQRPLVTANGGRAVPEPHVLLDGDVLNAHQVRTDCRWQGIERAVEIDDFESFEDDT